MTLLDAHVILFQKYCKMRNKYITKELRKSDLSIDVPTVIDGLKLKISKGRYFYSWNESKLTRTDRANFNKMLAINDKHGDNICADFLFVMNIISDVQGK